MHVAVKRNISPAMIKLLISAGADVDVSDEVSAVLI